MSREAVDETLAGLGAAHDRIAAAMFTIDSHPALAYLRGGGLSGLTETRWAALQPEVDRLVAQAASVGLDGAAQPLSDLLAEVAKQDLGDPLSAAPGGRLSASAQVRIDGVVARMAALRERAGALVGIRDGYPRRVAELRALVDGVAAAEERLATVYARATDRIADTGLPPPPTGSARVLLGRLADLDRLHAQSPRAGLVGAAHPPGRPAPPAPPRGR